MDLVIFTRSAVATIWISHSYTQKKYYIYQACQCREINWQEAKTARSEPTPHSCDWHVIRSRLDLDKSTLFTRPVVSLFCFFLHRFFCSISLEFVRIPWSFWRSSELGQIWMYVIPVLFTYLARGVISWFTILVFTRLTKHPIHCSLTDRLHTVLSGQDALTPL